MRSWGGMQGFTLVSDVVAIAIVLALAWWQTRRFRQGVHPADYRRIYGRSLFRLSAWALGGYMLFTVFSSVVLRLVGFQYPK